MKFALRDLIEEFAHLRFLTCDLKFYATVRQITDPAGYLKTFGNVAYCETEADALHAAFIKHLKRDHHLLQDEAQSSPIYTNRRDRNCLPDPQLNRQKRSTGHYSPARSRLLPYPRC